MPSPGGESLSLMQRMHPAEFPASLALHHRGTGNIVYLQNMWLDFESADLPPNELPQLFPHLRMLVTNTFHHTADKPRFRVIIPTTQPVTSEAYLLLYENIARKLEDAGYFVHRNRKRQK